MRTLLLTLVGLLLVTSNVQAKVWTNDDFPNHGYATSASTRDYQSELDSLLRTVGREGVKFYRATPQCQSGNLSACDDLDSALGVLQWAFDHLSKVPSDEVKEHQANNPVEWSAFWNLLNECQR